MPASGRPRSCGATCASGRRPRSTRFGVNFLFDRSDPLHLSADELSLLTGVPKSTMANKSRRIRDLLGVGPFDRELCRRDLLEQSPVAWLVAVDGIVVDARWLPPEVQAEARRRGLIPDLDATAPAA